MNEASGQIEHNDESGSVAHQRLIVGKFTAVVELHAFALRDVFNHGDMMQGWLAGKPHRRNCQIHPLQGAIWQHIAFLQVIAANLSRLQFLHVPH